MQVFFFESRHAQEAHHSQARVGDDEEEGCPFKKFFRFQEVGKGVEYRDSEEDTGDFGEAVGEVRDAEGRDEDG